MKKKILVALSLLIVVIALTASFSGCSDNTDGSSSSGTIDNSAASKDHSKIFYYTEGNVAYDDDNDCYEYCFMTPYLAAYPTGGAVIVFPGGGYSHLSNASDKGGKDNDGDQKESSDVAKFYNEKGISVFVVNYRTTSVDSTVCYKQILSDATRAIKYVRKNAAKYYVKKNKIAVQGYSAGGHLASVMLTKGGFEIEDDSYVKDETDSEDCTVNAAVLCYPVISLSESFTHKSTSRNFSGGDDKVKQEYSSEKNVTPATSPCFLWCHDKDGTVSSENTRAMYDALLTNNVECEAHIFDDNGETAHGIGIAENYPEAKVWTSLATEFLKQLGF